MRQHAPRHMHCQETAQIQQIKQRALAGPQQSGPHLKSLYDACCTCFPHNTSIILSLHLRPLLSTSTLTVLCRVMYSLMPSLEPSR
jgi:hypothetical protein